MHIGNQFIIDRPESITAIVRVTPFINTNTIVAKQAIAMTITTTTMIMITITVAAAATTTITKE